MLNMQILGYSTKLVWIRGGENSTQWKYVGTFRKLYCFLSQEVNKVQIYTHIGELSIVQCYAITDIKEVEEKINIYHELTDIIELIGKGDILVINGDLNAKVGNDNKGAKVTMKTHGRMSQNNLNVTR